MQAPRSDSNGWFSSLLSTFGWLTLSVVLYSRKESALATVLRGKARIYNKIFPNENETDLSTSSRILHI